MKRNTFLKTNLLPSINIIDEKKNAADATMIEFANANSDVAIIIKINLGFDGIKPNP
tara:strand:+ start:22 stop:192 length:171 start_codon:yes stop_codon:yes gene_type:complete